MAQLTDETRSTGPQDSIPHKEREVFLPVLEPARLEPPTHPAMPRLCTGRLRFAPGPTRKTAAPARREDWVERVFKAGWSEWTERAFEAGWTALLLGCAAECIYRLLWAVQP